MFANVFSVFYLTSNSFAHTASISTSDNIGISVVPVGDNANITTDNLRVISTCPLGYNVTIAGPTDNTLYLNGNSSNNTSTISASSGTAANPVSILGSNLGTWGYNLSAASSIDSNFIGLTNTPSVIKTKDSASATPNGDSFSVYYGASVTTNNVSGSYTLAESSQGAEDNTISYYLTPNANCASYVIRYNDNGANSTTTMGITHTVVEDDEVMLAASNYKRAGYGFAGWSTVALNPDSATFQSDLATAKAAGKVFGPNETIMADAALLAQATAENNVQYVTMYAIWVKPAANATLQGWGGCSSLNNGDVIALTDTRDNQVYAVAKLADGECWMIENLRLDTNNSTDATKAQGFGGSFSGLANSETANFSNSTTSNSKYSTSNITGSNQGYRFPRYNNSNTNSAVSNMTVANANIYSYGNYYTWAAAKANTGDLTTASDSETAKTSICPAGWKLPYGNDSGNGNTAGGFYYLNYKINNDSNITDGTATARLRAFPNNYLYSGYLEGNSLSSRGTGGGFWSATANSNNGAFSARFTDSYIYPGTYNNNKFIGRTVRCVSANSYTITIKAGTGVSALTANGWSGSGTGTLTKEVGIGETIDLSSIIPTRKTGYTGTGYSFTGGGSISGSNYTVGTSDGEITIGATGLNTPTCGISGGDTKVYNYAATTLTATSNASNFDTTSANITYSFGYSTSATGTLSGFSTAQAGNTYDVAKNAFYNTRYYGVRVTITDKTDSSITSTCTSGSGAANRTAVYRYNSRVNFNANGGTLAGSTSPVYVAYENAATYSGRTNTTAKAIPSVTPPAGKNFAGWWTLASGGTKVINEDGTLVTSASGWVEDGKWIRTTTNSSAVTGDTLYAHFTDLYVVTISAGPGISSLTGSGWTGSGTGTLTKEFEAGQTIDLSTITVADKTGYTGSSYSKTSGSGTLSGSTFTVGEGVATITFKATGLNAPTCTISGGDTKVYNYAATTLTATNVSSSYDTNSADITYSFGYNTSATGTLGNFSTAQASNTYDVAKDAFYNVRYYGVTVTVTDKTDSSITSTCTSGSGAANRTAVTRVNSRINFNANGGTLSHSNPVYVAYDNSAIYNSRTAATAGSIPTVTPASGKRFNGWWTAASGGTQVINRDGSLVTSAANWLDDGKWIRTSTNSTAVAADTLHAQYVNLYTITISAGNGVSSLTASGWTGTGTGTLTKEFEAGETIDLSTITAANKTGYTGVTYSSAGGSISGSTYTVGSSADTITFKATGLNTPTCTISGGDTKVYNHAATTLTATSNASNFDTSSADITYSFGYSTTTNGTLGNFSTTQASNTYDVAKDAFYNVRYYGVKVTVTDKSDNSITSTCTSGTGTGTGTTVANRTTATRVNSRINFIASSGTISGTNPIYVAYQNSAVYNTRTGTTAGTIPTVTPASGKRFNGWWTEASGGYQVIDASGNIQNSVGDWTNASGQWILTDTTNTTSVNTLYAQFIDLYTITLNATSGISSLTASGWTGTGTGTLTKEFEAGETIDLSTITAANKTGYTGSTYSKTSGSGTLSGSTFTVGSGVGTITFKATGLNTPACTISGGDTRVYNYVATTLTAGSNSASYDTDSANITYSFGYATSTTGTLSGFSTAQAGNTYDVAKDAFRNVRYYGVRVTVTDKTDSSITSTCTSGTGTGTGGRTAVYRYNSRVNFNANGGTLSGTSPVYVSYESAATYSGRTNTTAKAIPSVTPPSGKNFAGWWTAASGGNQVINASGDIVAASDWTNENGQWIRTTTNSSAVAGDTLYAHFTDLYVVTISAGPGISSLTASGWSGSGTGTLTKEFEAGETIDLSTITVADKTGYTGSSYSKTSGSGTLSGSTFTVGEGATTITFKATGLNTPVCTIQGGDTKVYNYAATTLTATSNVSNFDTSSADITYSFGYATSTTATLGNFSTAQAGNTYDVAKNAFYNVRYYGVKVTVTDKTDSSITSTCTSGTGATNRTAVYRYNSRINFNANGGTLSGTSPVYVAYENSATYSSRTATTTRAIPTVTAPAGKKFNGWWTAATNGTQVINASGDIVAASGWTNASGQWIRTSTNSGAVTGDTLYAQYTDLYTITLTVSTGISSLTASGWTGSGTSTLTKVFDAGETIDLSTITATNITGFTGSVYSKASGSGTLSGSTFTVGSGDATITFRAASMIGSACEISGGDTKVFNYADTTLTATDVSSIYDLDYVNITYSFGYSDTNTGTISNYGTPQTSNTYNVAKNEYYDVRYYGVRIDVASKDFVFNRTCDSLKTAVYRYNSRVNFNANGGTLSHSNPVYVAYENSATYSSRTATTTRAIPSVTPPSRKVFDGWWTAASGGNQVINASGNIVAASGWTNASGQWIRTTTNSEAVAADTLYAHFVDDGCVPAPGEICYQDNGANSVTTMDAQTVGSSDTSVVLWASNFQRSGYGFAGWNTAADGSGTNYGPNQTIEDTTTLNTIKNSGLDLYAMWVEPAKDTWNSVLTFQTADFMNETLISGGMLVNKPIGYVTALKDERDDQVYAIAKLADDNYWMIENLRYASTYDKRIQSQGYGGNFSGLATAETANFSNSTTANSKYSTSNITGNNQGYRFPRFNNSNTNSPVSTMTTPDANIYSYGNYYSWAAAKANTSDLTTASDSDAAYTSICPRGWKLPSGTGSGDFGGLSNSLGGLKNADGVAQSMSSSTTPTGAAMSKIFRTFPNNFVYSGEIMNSTIYSRGSSNYYSTSTAYNGSSARFYRFNSTDVYQSNYTLKSDGWTIRCISPTHYAVAFNANGGTGTMNDQSIYYGVATNLSSNTFTAPYGYEFDSWNTAADGSGTSYANSASVTNIYPTEVPGETTRTLYAQWKCGAGYICYDDNGANSATGMNPQAIASDATAINLWASNFQRSGYGFAGWNTEPDGSGTMYGPNATIDDVTIVNDIKANSLKLYAIWVEPAKDSSNNVLTFQTNNLLTVTLNDNSTLDSKPVGYVTALKDARDNQVYAVAKLADGNYWMIENLRLEAAGTTGSTNQALSQGYGGVFTGLANAENANFDNVTTANSIYSTANITGNDQGYRFPRYNNSNTANTVSTMTAVDENIYSYGNYYTWAAAMANTTYFDNNKYSSAPANTSICPAGWRLPTGGTKDIIEQGDSDFYALSLAVVGSAPSDYDTNNETQYHDNNSPNEGTNASKAMRAYPNNFIYSGQFSQNNSIVNRGTHNHYWSSNHANNLDAYRLAMRDTYVYPATNANYTYRGDSIRCVAGKKLYREVSGQSKGTQTSADLQANITKSNSGVYEYNSSVFGAATDANNNYKIFYYRGILDNTTGTYGSNGDGVAYPNYVRLGNTCWRIVRTTGSGGTKMIYNGNWTGSTCANATTSAQVGTSAFNGSSDTTSRQWVRVGYTYRSAYASTATTSRTLANTFGTNTSFANNSTSSNIKSYIEGTWFTGANGVSAYQSMLEPSAGYCNDRTVYNNATPAVIQADTLSVAQYATSATRYNFGALIRNVSTTQIPSLGCPRSTVDLYTTSAASNGNKQLTRAAALLTADEASFAGSGNRITAENGSDYDPNSFLNSGSEFLLLSPYYRATTGIANVFEINANGAMTYISTGTTTTGVRPVISLKPGTVTTIGSGTATDPWIIKAP